MYNSQLSQLWNNQATTPKTILFLKACIRTVNIAPLLKTPLNRSSNPQTHMVKETDFLKLHFKQVCITHNIL